MVANRLQFILALNQLNSNSKLGEVELLNEQLSLQLKGIVMAKQFFDYRPHDFLAPEFLKRKNIRSSSPASWFHPWLDDSVFSRKIRPIKGQKSWRSSSCPLLLGLSRWLIKVTNSWARYLSSKIRLDVGWKLQFLHTPRSPQNEQQKYFTPWK